MIGLYGECELDLIDKVINQTGIPKLFMVLRLQLLGMLSKENKKSSGSLSVLLYIHTLFVMFACIKGAEIKIMNCYKLLIY